MKDFPGIKGDFDLPVSIQASKNVVPKFSNTDNLGNPLTKCSLALYGTSDELLGIESNIDYTAYYDNSHNIRLVVLKCPISINIIKTGELKKSRLSIPEKHISVVGSIGSSCADDLLVANPKVTKNSIFTVENFVVRG